MAKNQTAPTVTTTDRGEKHAHPSYGVVSMNIITGGGDTMFGSDIKHSDRIRIEVKTAEVERSISNDWVHPQNTIVCFEMSHSQFAQFITSQGKYSGTPITLQYAPVNYKLENIPGIAQIETKNQTFQKEIRKTAGEEIRKQFGEEISKLGEMIESGKMSKKELSAIHSNLKNRMQNFAPNMEYVVQQAEEALEKATSDAKIEVEAWIDNRMRAIGQTAVKALTNAEVNNGNQELLS